METLVEALNRLRGDGYTQDFAAVAGGDLRCGGCGSLHPPETMVIGEIVRFEGDSNPDDEAILVAMRCSCGFGGLYSAAYGPDTSSNDVAALTRLPRS